MIDHDETAVNQGDRVETAAEKAARESYQRAIDAELVKLEQYPHFKRTMKKRTGTIMALIAYEVEGTIAKKSDLWKRPDTISEGVFYATNKDWAHDADYKTILDSCLTIARRYYAGKQLREQERKRDDLVKQELAAKDQLFKKIEAMLAVPVTEQEIETDTGKVILKPGKFTFGQAAQMATAASNLGRRALGMETERTRELTWMDELAEMLQRGEITTEDILKELTQAEARQVLSIAGVRIDLD